MHADIASLEFLGKSATVPKYALLIVDLFSLKVCVYPMQSRKQQLKCLNIFYVEIKNKRNMQQNLRLQTDNEFQQVKIKDLINKHNVATFTTDVRGEKDFAAEQKLRELKMGISKVKTILKTIFDQNSAKISLTTIIKRSAENMNNVKSGKYKLTLNEMEKNLWKINDLEQNSILNVSRYQKIFRQTRQVRYKTLL